MKRIEALDGLRAIAVSIVIASHLLIPGDGLAWRTQLGFVGVYIFFGISGYIITRTLLADAVNLPRFYVRRVFRIVPALFVYLVTVAGLGYASRTPWAPFAFLCNTGFVFCGWSGGHTWSLAFEEQFYFVYPAFLAWIALRRQHPVILALGLVGAAIPIILPLPWLGHRGSIKPFLLLALGAACAYYPPRIPGIVKRILAVKPLPQIGRISYSLYLWQQLLLMPNADRLLVFPLVVGAAIASYFLIERPLIRVGHRLAAALGREGGGQSDVIEQRVAERS